MVEDRRHSAIMFTDIVGYTALMGSDEDRAFEVLGKNRKIHTKLIEQFKRSEVSIQFPMRFIVPVKSYN